MSLVQTIQSAFPHWGDVAPLSIEPLQCRPHRNDAAVRYEWVGLEHPLQPEFEQCVITLWQDHPDRHKREVTNGPYLFFEVKDVERDECVFGISAASVAELREALRTNLAILSSGEAVSQHLADGQYLVAIGKALFLSDLKERANKLHKAMLQPLFVLPAPHAALLTT